MCLPKQVCTVAAPLAADPSDRADGMSPAAPRRPRRSRAARGERARLAGNEGNIAGHGRARLRRPAAWCGERLRPWHRPIMAPVSLPGLARGLHIMIIDRETFTE